MSMTVSRGFHNASRWTTPTLHVLENLRIKDYKSIYVGAISALEIFFKWTLAGFDVENRLTRNSGIPLAGAVCAFDITLEVFFAAGERTGNLINDLPDLERRIRRYLSILSGIRDEGRFIGTEDEEREFIIFLSTLVEQGRIARRVGI